MTVWTENSSTLWKIMVDSTMPAAARVRAADRILDGAHQAIEWEDIEVRLAALERAAGETKTPGG